MSVSRSSGLLAAALLLSLTAPLAAQDTMPPAPYAYQIGRAHV